MPRRRKLEALLLRMQAGRLSRADQAEVGYAAKREIERDGGVRSCNGFARRSDPRRLVVSGFLRSAPLTWKLGIVTEPSSPAGSTLDSDRPKTKEPALLKAVHTANFPALLRQLGASLLVTTYRAGKLVLVRDEGD